MAGKRSARKGQPRGRQHLAFAGVGTVTQLRCPTDWGQLVVDVRQVGDNYARVLRCPTCPFTRDVPAAVEVALAGGDLLPGIEEDTMSRSNGAAAVAEHPMKSGGRSARNVTPQPGEAPGELTLAVGALNPSPLNPRRRFDQDRLQELADSLRENGMLQPVVVRPIPAGQPGHGAYWIVAGERRWRAAQLAGLTHVPVRILDHLDDARHLKLAIIENDILADLEPVETARAYRQLIEMTGQTQAQMAKDLGRAPSTISNAMRLLDLPEDVLARISAGELSVSHGKALTRWSHAPLMVSKLAGLVAEHGWATKDLERGIPDSAVHVLQQAGAAVKLDKWAAEFDVKDCEQCPLSAYAKTGYGYGVYLRPAHYRELQKAGEAAKRAAVEALTAKAKATGTKVMDLKLLDWDQYERLADRSRPPGCTSACPCEAPALDRDGTTTVLICTDRKRYRGLQQQQEKAAAAGRRETHKAEVARLELRVDVESEPGSRFLAVLAARTLAQVGSPTLIRTAIERHAPELLFLASTKDRTDWLAPENLRQLEGLQPAVLVKLAVEALGRQELQDLYGSPNSGSWMGRATKWLLGIGDGKAAAPSLPIDEDDEYLRISDVRCGTCGGDVTVVDEVDDRGIAEAVKAGRAAEVICETCERAAVVARIEQASPDDFPLPWPHPCPSCQDVVLVESQDQARALAAKIAASQPGQIVEGLCDDCGEDDAEATASAPALVAGG